jgi:hypothetical protein
MSCDRAKDLWKRVAPDPSANRGDGKYCTVVLRDYNFIK